jgi:hypothetical protein
MSTLELFFAWPGGGVWSNLIASVIWVPIAAIPVYIKQHRHHQKVEKSLKLLHEKIDNV